MFSLVPGRSLASTASVLPVLTPGTARRHVADTAAFKRKLKTELFIVRRLRPLTFYQRS